MASARLQRQLHDSTASAVEDFELDPARLDGFEAIVAAHSRARMRYEELWSAFANAFPGRPQGADERRWLACALTTLEHRGVIRLPTAQGKSWDRSLDVAIPKSIEIIGVREPTISAEHRTYPWHPRLAWVAQLRFLPEAHAEFLRRVHRGLVEGSFDRPAPLKYRSLQLTGNEKRLGDLAATQLFGPGRLDFDLLGCTPELLPLARERVGSSSTIIVFENAAAFEVARSTLLRLPNSPYGWIGFGDGARFESSVRFLATVDPRPEQIAYVGDMDAEGLRIATRATRSAEQVGLPGLHPALGIHQAMLREAERLEHVHGWPHVRRRRQDPLPDAEQLVGFLPKPVRETALKILRAGNRIPEEVLGPDALETLWLGHGVEQQR